MFCHGSSAPRSAASDRPSGWPNSSWLETSNIAPVSSIALFPSSTACRTVRPTMLCAMRNDIPFSRTITSASSVIVAKPISARCCIRSFLIVNVRRTPQSSSSEVDAAATAS
jgi:hypothetical protein